MNNPAPNNNSDDSATCATSSNLLARDTTLVVRRLCLSGVANFRLVVRHAETNPNNSPVNIESVNVNNSTRQFSCRSTPAGKSPASFFRKQGREQAGPAEP